MSAFYVSGTVLNAWCDSILFHLSNFMEDCDSHFMDEKSGTWKCWLVYLMSPKQEVMEQNFNQGSLSLEHALLDSQVWHFDERWWRRWKIS